MALMIPTTNGYYDSDNLTSEEYTKFRRIETEHGFSQACSYIEIEVLGCELQFESEDGDIFKCKKYV